MNLSFKNTLKDKERKKKGRKGMILNLFQNMVKFG